MADYILTGHCAFSHSRQERLLRRRFLFDFRSVSSIMPNFRIKADRQETIDIVEEVFAQTKILKRQIELELGRWNFVVFGQHEARDTILREGCAVHLRLDNSLVYIATLGDPDKIGMRGMPIEEFAHGDIPDELRDLEIYQIDPVRPLKVFDKRTLPPALDVRELILKEFEAKNVAVIETPDEKYWSLSVLKYLYECDRYFPDALTEAIKKGNLPVPYC